MMEVIKMKVNIVLVGLLVAIIVILVRFFRYSKKFSNAMALGTKL